ncbi:GNAT family N-acetyltransferase [Bizionia sp. KMM 8389]
MNQPSPFFDSPLYQVRLITAEEAHLVRHPVLRAGKPKETCVFDGDYSETTFHYGIFHTNSLVGAASFLKNINSEFTEDTQYQLRGMCVLEAYQNKGLGRYLLAAGLKKLQEQGVKRLWFNAREKAINFYKNQKCITVGSSFQVPEIGTHYLMTREI